MAKKQFYITLDTETAGSLGSPIVYDLGFSIHDRDGNEVEKHSIIIYEIFYQHRNDLMKSAYYADKIPQYERDIANGDRIVLHFKTARRLFYKCCKSYNIRAIMAFNARFDVKALQHTNDFMWGTTSEEYTFLPSEYEVWDTLKMVKQILGNSVRYENFCFNNGFLTKNGKPKFTAEVVYRYISKNPDFVESHTGLEDVAIEKEIFTFIVRKGKMKTLDKVL